MGLSLTQSKKRILKLLDRQPMHGYVLAQELDVHGSTIYEHLNDLSNEGYIEGKEDGRRIVYTLTRKGELILKAESIDN